MKPRPGPNASWGLLLSLLALTGVAIGCGGGKGTSDAAGPITGAAGDGGTLGAGGSGGVSGTACAVGERTPNIQDCAEFDHVADSVMSERAVLEDGGVYLPGGELAVPMGGTLVDGDYGLVRAVWTSSGMGTRRTIRLSSGGTYSEWVVDQDERAVDGGIMHYRINATLSRSGNTLHVDTYNCGGSLADSFGYTASGDQLILFNSNAGMFVYQRTCTRR